MRRTEPQLHATVVQDPLMLVNGTKDPVTLRIAISEENQQRAPTVDLSFHLPT
jgi:hypothetical protein